MGQNGLLRKRQTNGRASFAVRNYLEGRCSLKHGLSTHGERSYPPLPCLLAQHADSWFHLHPMFDNKRFGISEDTAVVFEDVFLSCSKQPALKEGKARSRCLECNCNLDLEDSDPSISRDTPAHDNIRYVHYQSRTCR